MFWKGILKTMTVKQMINQIRSKALKDIQVDDASTYLSQLSSLLGNVNEEWVEAEMAYNQYFEKMIDDNEKVTDARIRAKASLEYERKIRAEGVRELVHELINSMKWVIKIKMQEKAEAQY